MPDIRTKKEFAEMTYSELHRELKKMLGQAKRMTVWFNAVERVNLLPALLAMKEKVAQPGRREPDPNKPNWEDECRSLGITPDIVKKWKQRTQTESDIRHLIGEEPNRPAPRSSDSVNGALAVKHLQDLCKAVLEDDTTKAESMALTLIERYGFGF